MFSTKSVMVIFSAKCITEVNSTKHSLMNQAYAGWLSQPWAETLCKANNHVSLHFNYCHSEERYINLPFSLLPQHCCFQKVTLQVTEEGFCWPNCSLCIVSSGFLSWLVHFYSFLSIFWSPLHQRMIEPWQGFQFFWLMLRCLHS